MHETTPATKDSVPIPEQPGNHRMSPMDRKEIVFLTLGMLALAILMIVTEWDTTACVVLHSLFGWCR